MFPNDRAFSFVSMAYPGDTFGVVSFHIEEGLNTFFRAELLLCSKESAIGFDEILESPASIIMHGPDQDWPVQGFISVFEQLHHAKGLTFYRCELSPRLWWMTLGTHCQVFLDKSIPQILEEVLQQGGLDSPRYQFKLQKTYPAREMVCQYNESHFDFFMRWLEREGMYFYFERQGSWMPLVITDSLMAHTDLLRHPTERYVSPSGLQHVQDNEVVTSLCCRQSPVMRTLQLKDRNYQTPALNVSGQQQVHEAGIMDGFAYGDHLLTPSEASRLASVRSEAIKADSLRFFGTSTVRSFRGGLIFTLSNHFRKDFNRAYLIVSCRHQGNQADYLEAGLHKELQGLIEEGPVYTNTFSAIPAEVQYRPLPSKPKPRICGTLAATIDAEGSGEYANLDEQGRYKVILPFDLSGRKDGKASCWIRMMQPYAGTNHGMHFPLHKGAEVLLTFEAGDPDRPVIAGAVPNPSLPSPVTNADQTMCKLTTSGQNKIHFEDLKGSQRILFSSPTANSWLRMGAPNDPPATAVSSDGDVETKHDSNGFRIYTTGSWNQNVHESLTCKVGGNATAITIGGNETLIGGFDNKTVVGARTDLNIGDTFAVNIAFRQDIAAAVKHELTVGKHYVLHAATKVELGAKKKQVQEEVTIVNESQQEIRESSLVVQEESEEILELKTRLVESEKKLASMQTKLAESIESIAESETKLRQDINHVLSEEMAVVESAINMISSKVNVGEDDMRTFLESTEITEKTFL